MLDPNGILKLLNGHLGKVLQVIIMDERRAFLGPSLVPFHQNTPVELAPYPFFFGKYSITSKGVMLPTSLQDPDRIGDIQIFL